MKNNKKGFTLIELLAVIVILGVLMLIAIPAVTGYIDKSKKEAFIKEINSLVDTVRYGITSGDSAYSMNGKTTAKFDLSKIVLEKGKNTVKVGSLTVNTETNTYRVKITDEENNYCLSAYVDNVSIASIKDCNTGFEYVIGDVITYKGSNWRVIENAKFKEDKNYVTLMKEDVLSVEEIGNDYSYKTTGMTGVPYMAYYWSSTCHYDGTYGKVKYNNFDSSGCSGHNDYVGSKIKEVVDNYMNNYLDASELELVNQYMIRLITLSELQENFRLSTAMSAKGYAFDSKDDRAWVYQALDVYGFWTMSPNLDNTTQTWLVDSFNQVVTSVNVQYGYRGVRPVINLKKSVINNN